MQNSEHTPNKSRGVNCIKLDNGCLWGYILHRSNQLRTFLCIIIIIRQLLRTLKIIMLCSIVVVTVNNNNRKMNALNEFNSVRPMML